MKKLKFGSLLIDKGLSTYEPFLLKVLSSLVIFPDGDNVLNKYMNMKKKIDSISATGIYLRVVDKIPEDPIKDVIYIIDTNKEPNSLPDVVLVRIVEKLPDVIEKGTLYLIDESGYTEPGTSEGPTTDIEIDLPSTHEHDNYKALSTYSLTQDELIATIKKEANIDIQELSEEVDELQIEVEEIDELVGDGFESIPHETIDDIYE